MNILRYFCDFEGLLIALRRCLSFLPNSILVFIFYKDDVLVGSLLFSGVIKIGSLPCMKVQVMMTKLDNYMKCFKKKLLFIYKNTSR